MKPTYVARYVIATFLAFVLALVASEAKAQDRPVEGINYKTVSPNGVRPIRVEILRTANLDSKAFAEIFKTDMYSIRRDNPTKTLAVCLRGPNRAVIAGGIQSEDGRKTDVIWEGCPAAQKYVYLVPGVTLEITGTKYLSPDEERAALTGIKDCKDAACVQKQLDVLGSKVKVTEPPQEPQKTDQPPPPPDEPKENPSAGPQGPQKEQPTATPATGRSENRGMSKQDAVLFAFVAALAGLIIGGALVYRRTSKEIARLRRMLADAKTVSIPATPSSNNEFVLRAEKAEGQLRSHLDATKAARAELEQVCDDWGISIPNGTTLDALVTKVVARAKSPVAEDASVKALKADYEKAYGMILTDLNPKVILTPRPPLAERFAALRDRHVKDLAAANRPSDVMLTDATALGLDLTSKTAQDAYLAIREKQAAAETGLKDRLRHYATELKIDGIPPDASPILIAQNINDWCVKKNDAYDVLLEDTKRELENERKNKLARQLMWDLFKNSAKELGMDPDSYAELHLLANDVVKRFALSLDARDDELRNARTWLDGFFAEHPRLIKDLEDSKKAIIDLTEYKRLVTELRGTWSDMLSAKNLARFYGESAGKEHECTNDAEREAATSLRSDQQEQLFMAQTLRGQLVTRLIAFFATEMEEFEEHLFGVVPGGAEPAPKAGSSTLDPTTLVEVPPSSAPPPPPPRTLRGFEQATAAGAPPRPLHDLTADGGIDAALAALTPESVRAPKAPSFHPTNGASKANGQNGVASSAFTVTDQNIDECIRMLSLCSIQRPFVLTPTRHALLGKFLASKAECDPRTVQHAAADVQTIFLSSNGEDRLDKPGQEWSVFDLLYQLEYLEVYPRKLTQPPPNSGETALSG